MSLSQTEIFGFASDVISLLEFEKEKITLAGVDAEKLIKDLKELLEEAISSDAEQESLKVRALEATKKTRRLVHGLHIKASGTLDMVISCFGKSSVESSVIRRTRSRIRRPGNNKGSKVDSTEATVP